MVDEKEQKTPGPVKNTGRKQYPVILDIEVAEWAKAQPDGLSGLVRRLLRREFERTQRQRFSAA